MTTVNVISNSNQTRVTGVPYTDTTAPTDWETVDPPLPLRSSMPFPHVESQTISIIANETAGISVLEPMEAPPHEQGATYVSSQSHTDEFAQDIAADFERQIQLSRNTTQRQSLHICTDTHIASQETIQETSDLVHTHVDSENAAINTEDVIQLPEIDQHLTTDSRYVPILGDNLSTSHAVNERDSNQRLRQTRVEERSNPNHLNRNNQEITRHIEGSRSERYYDRRDDFRRGSFHLPPVGFDNGVQQKAVLESMSKGLGNFTAEMAEVMINKLRPEYEEFARQVGREVKETTMLEIKDLRDKVTSAEQMLNELTDEKQKLQRTMDTEIVKLKKEIEKESSKHASAIEEKNETIDKLEKETQKLQTILKERDKAYKRAGHKAKVEEQKRVQLEEEHQIKLKEMQRQLDKAKGDLLVQTSRRRLHNSAKERERGLTFTTKLRSHHGMHPRQLAHASNVRYDEGDP